MGRKSKKRKKSKKTQKAVIGIIILLLVCVGIGGIWYVMLGKDYLSQSSGEKKANNSLTDAAVSDLDKKDSDKTDSDKADSEAASSESAGVAEPELDSEQKSGQEMESEMDKRIQDIIAGMTLEEKAAQLFFVTPEGLTGVGQAIAAGETTQSSIEQIPVGGIVYFSQNIESEDQLRTMIANTQSYSRIPLFIGVDEEGGTQVARIANSGVISVAQFPDMADIGATGDPNQAYQVGSTIGAYLSDLGFNLDFAPVADVLTNPANTAIGARSFGVDAAMDAQMVSQEVKGLQEQNVSAVVKHFPGHGGTSEDSHEGAAVVNSTLEQLQAAEFLPFEAGIQADVDFVMVGHLSVPAVTGGDTPATLSSVMVTDILRNQLNFQKVVVTDSMSMGAVTEYYTADQAAVMAVQAGCDMILMPADLSTAYRGIVDAVNAGTLSEERIEESVHRILMVKYQKNL